ncbi:MAG: hypothetical protein H8D23_25440, partial [Candidatus Brocadiales bacterium]|nr:hypothetical protein [Candidatus Brocadiales bacterium]
MNYEKMTKAELINEIKSLKSGMASSKHKEIGTVLLDPEEKYLKLVESAFDAIFIANARTGIILFA